MPVNDRERVCIMLQYLHVTAADSYRLPYTCCTLLYIDK